MYDLADEIDDAIGEVLASFAMLRQSPRAEEVFVAGMTHLRAVCDALETEWRVRGARS